MEIVAVCQLLANMLRGGDAFDLLVLKELVEAMTGITINVEVSDKQVRGAGIAGVTAGCREAPSAASRSTSRSAASRCDVRGWLAWRRNAGKGSCASPPLTGGERADGRGARQGSHRAAVIPALDATSFLRVTCSCLP